MSSHPRVAVLYEHPEWFRLLFAELTRRGIPFVEIPAHQLLFDAEDQSVPAPLIVNRMSPSAWKRGHANAVFAVKEYLRHVEARRAALVNGSRAYEAETSKALQLDLFRKAGVAYPRARVINHPAQAVAAAIPLRFPVVVKPNIGGSGAGIFRFDSLEALRDGVFDLGLDSTGLVQEFVPARGNTITRIEILNGEFLYAIRISTDFSNFNLCPADICHSKIEVARVDPPPEAVTAALQLSRLAHLDVGGIEYLIDDRDGRLCFYDINALSNFVSDAVQVVGFDPTVRFVDYLETRLARLAY